MIDKSLKNANILIVDDQESNIDLLTGFLTKKGYDNLRSTMDPRQTAEIFSEFKPDLILLDLMMPQLNGFQVMEQLRPLIPPEVFLPILVLTADITSEVKRRALANGATDFLTKPLDITEVDLRIKNLLEARSLHLQLQNQNQILEELVQARTAQLRESEERNRAMLEAIPDLIFINDNENRFINYHANNLDDLLVQPDRFIGKKIGDVFPRELADVLTKACQNVLNTGQKCSYEYTLKLKEKPQDFEARLVPCGEKEVLTLVRNITEGKRQENLLKALYRASLILQQSMDWEESFTKITEVFHELDFSTMVWIFDENKTSLIPKYLGYSSALLTAGKKLTGRKPEEFVIPIDKVPFFQRVVQHQETCIDENTVEGLTMLFPDYMKKLVKPFVKLLKVQKMILAPMVINDEVVSVFTVQSPNLQREDIPLVKSFANMLAAAWHKIELYNLAKIEISERKKAEQHIKQQLQRLSALRKIDQTISGSVNINVTLELILTHVIEQLKVDAASILILNPLTMMLEYTDGRGFRGKEIEQSRIRLKEGHAGKAAFQKKTIHIPDLREKPEEFLREEVIKKEEFVSYFAIPLITKGDVTGIMEVFHRSNFNPDQEWLNYCKTLAGQVAIAIDSIHMFDDLQRSNSNLIQAYDTTIEGWSHALDLRDKETEGHTQRVTELTLKLARAAGISEDELVHVRRGALLHDIGKMGVPDHILLKPDKLTDEEWVSMRKHPVFAFELLSPIAYLTPALDIPYCHHEKWDGSGYPRGLKGEQIPMVARLFSIIDVWDALLSDRPYRQGWPKEKVIEHIKSLTGTHFDPKALELFLMVMNEDIRVTD
jgi:response regulator RpfG family c-di-GMP phosphodiesterase